MQRNILEDIKPLTSTNRKPVSEYIPKIEYQPAPETSSSQAKDDSFARIPINRPSTSDKKASGYRGFEKPKQKSGGSMWGVTIVILVVLAGIIASYFRTATVTVVSRTADVTLEDSLVAKKGITESSLGFEIAELEDAVSAPLENVPLKESQSKAKGTVILYNSYSSASQILRIDTRLSSQDGKIYKTDKAVTVPGMKGKLPGSVTVSVTAENVGQDYNLEAGELNVVGFKGTKKYDGFIAKVSSSIKGGESGLVPDINDEARAKITESLTTLAKSKISERLLAQIPEGYTHWSDGVFFTPLSEPSVKKDEAGNTFAELQAKVAIVLFKTDDLERYLASEFVKDYDNGSITIKGLDTLEVALADKSALDPKTMNSVKVELKGPLHVVWDVDVHSLRLKLIGSSKKEFNSIVATFPSIKQSEVRITPPWMFQFPLSEDDIRVKLSE